MVDKNQQTTVGTSATAIEGTQYPFWTLYNVGPDTIYLGGSTVASGDGYPVAADESYSPPVEASVGLTGRSTQRLYGIAGATTSDARVLIQGKVNVS